MSLVDSKKNNINEVFLVTTSIEDTWPKINPIVFLGEWCRLYNRKSYWKTLNNKVVPYHWDDRIKLQKDYQYLNTVHEMLLVELTSQLNKLHGVNHSSRYWRIFIGPWLQCFVEVLFLKNTSTK